MRRTRSYLLALVAFSAALLLASEAFADGSTTALSVRITSPLGRTGFTGPIRIVAQVRAPDGVGVRLVRFYVQETLLGEDTDGPPFAVQWVDDNPFEPRDIVAEAVDSLGNAARDSVHLTAFDVAEAAHISSVLLEVAVQDKKGRFIGGLGASSFAVYEDDVAQNLDIVRQEAVPATFVLLIDSSQSMARRIDFVRDAAKRLIDRLRPVDRVIVAPFSRTVGAITGPTDDRQTVAEAIDAIESRGGTAILDSLTAMTTQLQGVQGRQAIVLLTDGYDEHSSNDMFQTLERIKGAHATLYVVGIGGVAGISLKGERFLRHLADDTGGRVFFPSREQELATVHELIAADVQHRYLISYTPSNQKVDGSWRQIRIETAQPEHRVRTRTGYLAPAPPPIRPTVEFTVTDTLRRHLEISATDLMVAEDGVEQSVEQFQEAVTPVSIVLALDSSGSMRKAAAAVMDAARGFVEALRPEDSLALMLFSDQPVFAHDLTTSRETSAESIGEYVASGGTALYDALADGLARLKRVPGRRVVVLMTDGRDENNAGTGPGSARTVDDVVRQIHEVDATVFTIALGPKIDRPVMERLAAVSGGEAYFPAEVGTLPDDYRRVLENLRRRYIVGYTSTNSNRDGAWRSVRIRTTTPGVVVTSRGGYFAPRW